MRLWRKKPRKLDVMEWYLVVGIGLVAAIYTYLGWMAGRGNRLGFVLWAVAFLLRYLFAHMYPTFGTIREREDWENDEDE